MHDLHGWAPQATQVSNQWRQDGHSLLIAGAKVSAGLYHAGSWGRQTEMFRPDNGLMRPKRNVIMGIDMIKSSQWRHNEREGVSNHQPHDRLLNRLFRHRWKKTPKLRVTGLCKGNSLVTGEFPAQRASNAEYISIWWCHHVIVNVTFSSVQVYGHYINGRGLNSGHV